MEVTQRMLDDQNQVSDEQNERKAGAYASLGVISALIFGLSGSICYDAIKDANQTHDGFYNTFVMLSVISTGTSVFPTVIFAFEYYLGERALVSGPAAANFYYSNPMAQSWRSASKFCIIVSLLTLIMSLAVLCIHKLSSVVGHVACAILVSFGVLTIGVNCAQWAVYHCARQQEEDYDEFDKVA